MEVEKDDLYGTDECDPHQQPKYSYCRNCTWILDATASLGFYGCQRAVLLSSPGKVTERLAEGA